ncbi:hypothetical protein, partial [Escherichia coli]|uniref:hypothetical protein n=1 Tax=Escherichia coli TaxID=562 RepID=UPI001BDC5FEF
DEYGAPTSSYSVLKPGRVVANDNGYGVFAPGVSQSNSSNSVKIGNTNIIVQGNVDSDIMPQLQSVLEQHREQTIEAARAAASNDAAT